MVQSAASLQGCGGRGRGGLLAAKRRNDKENGLPDGTGDTAIPGRLMLRIAPE
jgi:hypothetical protein